MSTKQATVKHFHLLFFFLHQKLNATKKMLTRQTTVTAFNLSFLTSHATKKDATQTKHSKTSFV
jgi:hypothetical protein